MNAFLMSIEQLQLLLRTEILLGSNPNGSDAVLVVQPEFCGARPDPTIPAQNHIVARTNDREPIEIPCAERNIRKTRITWKNNVIPALAAQQLT